MRHSKGVVPPRPRHFVDRAPIRAVLDEHGASPDEGRIVLVSAPTGYGKTVAVADWVTATPDRPTTWVTLDSADRDEVAWWRTILGALAENPSVPQDSALHGLGYTVPVEEPWDRDAFAATVLEALDELPVPVRLVLDDVHEIVGHHAQKALRALARHPVRGLTLVLCSRFDPPVGLDRLRLDGRLGELRVDELAFSVEDTTRLFTLASLPLTQDEAVTLVDRTEGWAAALRLVARSLRDAPDRSAVLADFAGDDRSVAEYLVDEVLSALSVQERRVVEVACVCSPVSVDLARALTDDHAAADVLEHLEATTAMVRATDRRGHSYQAHELLRSHVQARLRRSDADRLTDLYRRASAWFEAHDDLPQAVRFAALGGDIPATEGLLRTRAAELLGVGAFSSLQHSDELLWARGADARARIVLCLAALETGKVDHAAALLENAPPAADDEDQGTALLRDIAVTRLALARGQHRDAATVARRLAPQAVEEPPLRTLALATRGYAAATADPERAREDAQQALAAARHREWPYLVAQARTTLASSLILDGQVATAVEHARAVLDLAATHGWKDTPWPAEAFVVLALADLLGGRPDQALADVTQAEAVAAMHHSHHRHTLAVVQGATQFDGGQRTAGWQLLRVARTQVLTEGLDERHVAIAALLEQQAALALGRGREAAELAHAVDNRLDGTGDGDVIRTRHRWSTTRDPSCRRQLLPALGGGRPFLTAMAATEARVLDAEIALAAGQQPVARLRMREALRDAEEHGTVRPLLCAPPELHAYLERGRGSFGDREPVVARVLALVRDGAALPAHTLTEREREVLELLPTLQSIEEIAAELTVSANTVKTHTRSIYHKLGATNRRDAVARARRAGLLSTPV
ncbi:LuxR C-terminal-related transcriptional regulator [Actinomycetospora lutea]|uniref:LuxR C-terminal-related transcriptional regulator n=1 Tax=Actinomycetospora lutea TaxID=663604 RepID=UPI002367001F|nr:LuxR C-terminal-related transcriptional regulator [Actinomycetospora lutea]MDD7942483.1 LuxR C-terminal-related transcriptional regulator [Actinomycetospora lutea]